MQTPLEYVREKCIEANPSIKSKYHYSTGNNLRCSNCGDVDNFENRGKCTKGAVRPIQLADVLKSLENVKNVGIHANGIFLDFTKRYDATDIDWDLTKTLEDQSPKTILSIAEMLGYKS